MGRWGLLQLSGHAIDVQKGIDIAGQRALLALDRLIRRDLHDTRLTGKDTLSRVYQGLERLVILHECIRSL